MTTYSLIGAERVFSECVLQWKTFSNYEFCNIYAVCLSLIVDGTYIGCFKKGCFYADHYSSKTKMLSPNECTRDCKRLGYFYAGIRNRTDCMCSCRQTCNTNYNRNESKYCGVPCSPPNTNIFCGGINSSSIYKSK